MSTLRPAVMEMVYQRFAIEPQDQTAVIGSRVTLPCRVLDQRGPIQWTKDDFGLGAVRNLTGYERYAMIGSDEEETFTLIGIKFREKYFIIQIVTNKSKLKSK
ncbi:hypothetical protein PV325_012815 [Microctonus aethiopoides]|nr:hypothetical protein PV325_012815 [Microctonus aethiopoides]